MHLPSPRATSNYCSNTTVATMHHAQTIQNKPHTGDLLSVLPFLFLFSFFCAVLVRKLFKPHPCSGICNTCIWLASSRDPKEKVNSELLEDRWVFSALVKLHPRTSPHAACAVGRLCPPLEFKVQSSPSATSSLWTELLSQGPEPCLRKGQALPSGGVIERDGCKLHI